MAEAVTDHAQDVPARARKRAPRTFALVAVVAAIGAVLASLARIPLTVPADTINMNRVDPEKLALALRIDPALADRLVLERQRLGGYPSLERVAATPVLSERFHDIIARTRRQPDSLLRAEPGELEIGLDIPLALASRLIEARESKADRTFQGTADIERIPVLSADRVRRLHQIAIVRSPSTAFGYNALYLLLFLAFVWLSCRYAPQHATDRPVLLMLVWLLTTFGFLVRLAAGDPLRDAPTAGAFLWGVGLGVLSLLVFSRIPGRRSTYPMPSFLVRLVRFTGPGVFLLWAVAALVLDGGRRVGAPGLSWLGPFAALGVLVPYLRSLRPPALDSANPTAQPPRTVVRVGIRETELWIPLALAVISVVCTRNPGIGLVTGLSGACLIWLGTGMGWKAALGGALSFIGVALLAGLMPDGRASLMAFQSPWSRGISSPNRLAEDFWAFGSGGFWGAGLGLSEVGQSRLLATIGEDLGVIGSVMTLLLYALLIWRVHRLSVRTSADGSRWILIGIGCVLSAWTAFACASVAGVGPQAIVPLPFADFTRVAQIAWFSAIGLTLGLDRTADRGLGGLERRSYRLRVAALTYAVVALLIGGLGTRMWWLQAECGDDNAGHTLTLTERGRAVRTIANPRLVRFASTIERGSIYELGDQVLATSRLREISAALPGNPALAQRYYRAGRYYPLGPAAAALIGCWLADIGPISGMEREYNEHLRGFSGYAELVPAYRRRNLPARFAGRRIKGGDVVLALDANLQRKAYAVLLKHVTIERNVRPAAMMILDTATGNPLAAITTPSADPNRAVLADPTDPRRMDGLPVVDRATSVRYPPGSLFKFAIAINLPEEVPSFEAICRHATGPLRWTYQGRTYTAPSVEDDPSDPPHGRIGLERALKVGCNVYFAELLRHTDLERLLDYLSDISNPKAMPTVDEMAERLMDIATGESFPLITPMKMTNFIYQLSINIAPEYPSFLAELRFGNGRPSERFIFPPGHARLTYEGKALYERIRRALRESITDGPLEEIFQSLPITVAGRTAVIRSARNPDRRYAWFVGYAPYELPEYAIGVVVEGENTGFRIAAPAARDALKAALQP